jgi:integrase
MWSRDNARKRIFDKVVELADQRLEDASLAPTPEGLTPHSLRHIYISLQVALGHDPATIAQDAGHADMAVTFRIYTHVMRLNDGPGAPQGPRQRRGFGTNWNWNRRRGLQQRPNRRAPERRNPRVRGGPVR